MTQQPITPRQALSEVISTCTRATYAWGQQAVVLDCLRVLEALVVAAEQAAEKKPETPQ